MVKKTDEEKKMKNNDLALSKNIGKNILLKKALRENLLKRKRKKTNEVDP